MAKSAVLVELVPVIRSDDHKRVFQITTLSELPHEPLEFVVPISDLGFIHGLGVCQFIRREFVPVSAIYIDHLGLDKTTGELLGILGRRLIGSMHIHVMCIKEEGLLATFR